MQILKNLLFLFSLLGSFCSEAAACSCAVKSFNELVKDADAIYFATLQDARVVKGDAPGRWPFIQGRFEVRRTLKGKGLTGNMMLQTGLGGGDCGVPMTVAQTYIIFKKNDMDGIDDCDGTREVYSFDQDKVAAKVKAAISQRSPRK